MSESASQVVDINDRFYWSLSQLQKAFGPARETISKRLHVAGVDAVKQRAGFDVYHIRDAARAIMAGELPTFEGVDNPDDLPPKDRLDWFRGENEKTKCLKESGQLVPISEVTKEFSRVVKTCVRALETLPDILEMKCALDADEVILIERECDQVREQLADELSAD